MYALYLIVAIAGGGSNNIASPVLVGEFQSRTNCVQAARDREQAAFAQNKAVELTNVATVYECVKKK